MAPLAEAYAPVQLIYKVVDGHNLEVDIYLPHATKSPSLGHPLLINIHGGAFMLGWSGMVNQDQVKDCLNRSWIVLAPNHRLCPQVNLLEGPIQDCRDLLAWIHSGAFGNSLESQLGFRYPLDLDHVFAFGTSSGGTLALSLGYDVPRPVAGILDFYGPCQFAHEFWNMRLPHVEAKLPSDLSEEFLNQVFQEDPIPSRGGVSLEGQSSGRPDFNNPRVAFALTQIAKGKVMDAIFPSKDWSKIDPILNISRAFPPTFIVHGEIDDMVPMSLSQALHHELIRNGVECKMQQVPGEGHTFAGSMEVGSRTWNLQRRGFDFLENLINKNH